MYINVILPDLLYDTGVQRSGFRTTSKQISLRFLRLSVEVPRSIIYRKTFSENLCLQTLQDFLQLENTVKSTIHQVKICVFKHCKIFELWHIHFNSEIQRFYNCSKSSTSYQLLQLSANILRKSKWTRNYSKFVELKEVLPDYHSNFEKKAINCQKPSSPLKEYFVLQAKKQSY